MSKVAMVAVTTGRSATPGSLPGSPSTSRLPETIGHEGVDPAGPDLDGRRGGVVPRLRPARVRRRGRLVRDALTGRPLRRLPSRASRRERVEGHLLRPRVGRPEVSRAGSEGCRCRARDRLPPRPPPPHFRDEPRRVPSGRPEGEGRAGAASRGSGYLVPRPGVVHEVGGQPGSRGSRRGRIPGRLFADGHTARGGPLELAPPCPDRHAGRVDRGGPAADWVVL